MKVTIDASVFVADQIESETGHLSASTFLEYVVKRGVTLYTPVIAIAEVGTAIARFTRSTGLGECGMKKLYIFKRLNFRSIDIELAELAGKLGAKHFLRGADSIYYAVAKETHSPLVTLDKEILNRSVISVPVVTPADWLKQYATDLI